MRGQVWYVALLIGIMCFVRFSLSVVGYIDPTGLMEQMNIPIESNLQMPYLVRVWAIRDIVLAVIVTVADKRMVMTLLIACIAIDATDILSAHLSGLAGLFDPATTWSLKLTAIAALVPEGLAIALLAIHKTHTPDSPEINSSKTAV